MKFQVFQEKYKTVEFKEQNVYYAQCYRIKN